MTSTTDNEQYNRRERIIAMEGEAPINSTFLIEDANKLNGDPIVWTDATVCSWDEYVISLATLYQVSSHPLMKYINWPEVLEDQQHRDEIMMLEWDTTNLCWDYATINSDGEYNSYNVKIINNFTC